MIHTAGVMCGQDGKLYYTKTEDVSANSTITPTHVCDLVISTGSVKYLTDLFV